mmetsp:Transcript_43137/g.86542  ORF Transcript_43137/g.86542 Transcript_43137/m.86542 type:complete len:229 (+) Transcript_43137:44-730(+)
MIIMKKITDRMKKKSNTSAPEAAKMKPTACSIPTSCTGMSDTESMVRSPPCRAFCCLLSFAELTKEATITVHSAIAHSTAELGSSRGRGLAKSLLVKLTPGAAARMVPMSEVVSLGDSMTARIEMLRHVSASSEGQLIKNFSSGSFPLLPTSNPTAPAFAAKMVLFTKLQVPRLTIRFASFADTRVLHASRSPPPPLSVCAKRISCDTAALSSTGQGPNAAAFPKKCS